MRIIFAAGVKARHANAGIGFIHRTIGFDAQVRLQPPWSAGKSGRALVARPGIDLVELDHIYWPVFWRAK